MPNMGTIIPNMGINKISIADVLFSKSQQQVLGLLYGQPDKDFYTNEIIRITNMGTGVIQRELSKLTSVGFISVRILGNQKRYQANRNMPFFLELRGIILKTFGLADVLVEMLKPLKTKIEIAFIYGSIARQEDTANSDIDLMIITNKLTYAELFKHIEKAEIKLNRKINPTFYTSSEWLQKKKSNNNFITQIIKLPKIFLVGAEE